MNRKLRTQLCAVAAVLLMVASAFVVISSPDRSLADSAPVAVGSTMNTQTVTYYPTVSDMSSGTNGVSAQYYDIASSEYNPQFWNNSGKISQSIPNWTPPTTSKSLTTVLKLTGSASDTLVVNFPTESTEVSGLTIGYAVTDVACNDLDVEGARVTHSGNAITLDPKDTDQHIVTVTYTMTYGKVFGGWSDGTEYIVVDGKAVLITNPLELEAWEWNGNNVTKTGDCVYQYDPVVTYKISKIVEKRTAQSGDVFIVLDDGDGELEDEDQIIVVKKVTEGVLASIVFQDVTYAVDGFADVKVNSYLPGDTLPRAVSELFSMWIEPDLFTKVNSGTEIGTGTSGVTAKILENLPLPYYAPVRKTGNSIFTETSWTTALSNAGYIINYGSNYGGVARNEPSMYGTIVMLIDSNGKNNNFTGYSTNEYSTNFLTGTYRGQGNAMIKFSNSSGKLVGNAIFDNIDFDATKSSKHGNSNTGVLLANWNILIIGTNVDMPNVKTLTATREGAIPSVYGGNTDGSSKILIENKLIAFGDGNHSELKGINVATCLIIHSGLWNNVEGGAPSGTIGSNKNYLSTYLVFRGGWIIDTLVGGVFQSGTVNGGAESSLGENVGGTFVYVLGGIMPGDNYQDSQSNVYTTERQRFDNKEGSVLEGGGDKSGGNVWGSTHVFLSDESNLWDVQAGGRAGGSKCSSTYLEITGKAVVRHAACGTITDAIKSTNTNCANYVKIHVSGSPTVANVFGAGYDTYEDPLGRSMTRGEIHVEIADGTVGNLFGGGYRGSIGDPDHLDSLTIFLTVSGGEILGDIYGGGSGGVDKAKHDPNGAVYQFTGGGNKNSTGQSYVYGNISIALNGGQVDGNVYGGGKSIPALVSLQPAGNMEKDANDVAQVKGNISITLDGTAVCGNIYGGGRGLDTSYTMEDSVKVWNINSTDYTRTICLVYDSENQEYSLGSIPFGKVSSNPPFEYKLTDEYITKYAEYAKTEGDVSVTMKSGTVAGNVYGGGALGKVTGNISLTINGGSIEGSVFGGGLGTPEKDSVNGNITVTFNGGTIVGSLYGGSAYGKVNGNIVTVINGGSVGGSVFGGGLGRTGCVSTTRNRTLSMNGGTVTGSLYGGSSDGDDGTSAQFSSHVYSDSFVIVSAGTVGGSVFGGGFMGSTWGNTEVHIGYRLSDSGAIAVQTEVTPEPVISIGDSVYAGGDVKVPDQGEFVPYTQTLVQGNGTVKINGRYTDITMHGSIMGAGNSCNTGGQTDIYLDYFTNPETITGVHRATNVYINESALNISGRESRLEDGTTKDWSLFRIHNLVLQSGSTLWISNPLEDIHSLTSLNKERTPTTSSSPSNKIVFMNGSTIYIRQNDGSDIVYGHVVGYVVLSVANQATYGGYVLGSDASEGGFVVLKDGSYSPIDRTDMQGGVRCWFITGVSKKISTLIMPYSAQTGVVSGTVDIMKLQDDSYMLYTGGIYIPSSDTSFGIPGYSSGDELGLMLGFGQANGKTLVADSEHFIGTQPNNRAWTNTTFFLDGLNLTDGYVHYVEASSAQKTAAQAGNGTVYYMDGSGFYHAAPVDTIDLNGTYYAISDATQGFVFVQASNEQITAARDGFGLYHFDGNDYTQITNEELYAGTDVFTREGNIYIKLPSVDVVGYDVIYHKSGNVYSVATAGEIDAGNDLYVRSKVSVPLQPVNLSTGVVNNGTFTPGAGSGTYLLNLQFSGNPDNLTRYIGYVTLNLQEISEIVYYVTDNEGNEVPVRDTMVVNTIEIRIDLYVEGVNEGTPDHNDVLYTVEGDGSVDMNIPSGLTGHPVYLYSSEVKRYVPIDANNIGSFETKYYLNVDGTYTQATEQQMSAGVNLYGVETDLGSDLAVQGMKNINNTMGWRETTAGVILRTTNLYGDEELLIPTTGSGEDPNLPGTHNRYGMKLGVLSGGYLATLRFTLNGHTVVGEEHVTLVLLGLDQNGNWEKIRVNLTIRERSQISISFYDDEESVASGAPDAVYQFPYGSVINRANCPPTHENFVGWYSDPEFLNLFNFSTPLVKDLSLYARYTYVVTFDYMNGTTSKLYITATGDGVAIEAPSTPVNKGYTFGGWFTDSEQFIVEWSFKDTAQGIPGDKVNRSLTLYAKWVGIPIEVHFVYDNSEDQFAREVDQVWEYDQPYTIYLNGSNVTPEVRYGDTFGLLVPGGTISILEDARSRLITNIVDHHKGSIQFIRWQYHVGNDIYAPVYDDTTLNDVLLGLNSNVLTTYKIYLYAQVETIALTVTTQDDSGDLSTVIAAPCTFLVSPEEQGNGVYDFTFTLNNATRAGWQLVSWHNGHVTTRYVNLSKEEGINVKAEDEYYVLLGDGEKMIVVATPEQIRAASLDDGKLIIAGHPAKVRDKVADYVKVTALYQGVENVAKTVNGNDIRYRSVDEFNELYVKAFTAASESQVNAAKTGNGLYYKNGSSYAKATNEQLYNGASLYEKNGNNYTSVTGSKLQTYFSNYAIVYCWDGSAYHAATPDELTAGNNLYVRGSEQYVKAGSEEINHFYTLDLYYCTYSYRDYNNTTDSGSTVYYLSDYRPATYEEVNHVINGLADRNTLYYKMTPLYPDAGSVRTIRIHTVTAEDKIIYVTKESLIVTVDDGTLEYPLISYDTNTEANMLNNPHHPYVITYHAVWEQIEYTVRVENTSNGDIDVYYKGERQEVFTVHYGDRLDLTFTAHDKYQFYKWSCAGEFLIENEYSASTTLVVNGDCIIMATDIGERIVRLYMDINNGRTEHAPDEVYLKSKSTGEYLAFPRINTSDFLGNVMYREYAEMGGYDVIIRTPLSEYKIGEITVGFQDTNFNFEVYSVSLDIINDYDKAAYHELHPTSFTERATVGNGIVSYTEYVGRLAGSDNTLTITMVLSAGYSYQISKGYSPGYIYYEIEENNERLDKIVFYFDGEHYTVASYDQLSVGQNLYVRDGLVFEEATPEQIAEADGIYVVTGEDYRSYDANFDAGQELFVLHDGEYESIGTDKGSHQDNELYVRETAYGLASLEQINGGVHLYNREFRNFTYKNTDTIQNNTGLSEDLEVTWTIDQAHRYMRVLKGVIQPISYHIAFVLGTDDQKVRNSDTPLRDYFSDLTTREIRFGQTFGSVLYGDTEVTVKNDNTKTLYSEDYRISNWHMNDTLHHETILLPKARIDFSFLELMGIQSGDMFTVYAKVVDIQATSEVSAYIYLEDLNGSTSTEDGTEYKVYFTKSNNSYTGGEFLLYIREGFQYGGSVSVLTSSGTVNAVSTQDGNVLTISFETEDQPTKVQINYLRRTTNLSITVPADAVFSDAGWTLDSESDGLKVYHKGVKYGQTVTLPAVTKTDYHLTGWAPADNYDEPTAVTNGNSTTYTYTIDVSDLTGSGPSFTAMFTPDRVYTVTFITPVRTFRKDGQDTGKQRLTYELLPGTNIKTYFTDKVPELTSSVPYTFAGYDHDVSTMDTTITDDLLITARWTTDTFKLSWSMDTLAQKNLRVSATKDSNMVVFNSGGSADYHSEMILTLQYTIGYTIDLENTKVYLTDSDDVRVAEVNLSTMKIYRVVYDATEQKYVTTDEEFDAGHSISSIGTPKTGANGRGMKWAFFLDYHYEMVLRVKEVKVNVYFAYKDTNGNTLGTPTLVEVGKGANLDLPTPYILGYAHIDSWFEDSACLQRYGTSAYTADENKTFYALCTPLVYEVIFKDLQGAEITRAEMTWDVSSKLNCTPSSVTDKRFVGWYTGEQARLQYTATDTVRNLLTKAEFDSYLVELEADSQAVATLEFNAFYVNMVHETVIYDAESHTAYLQDTSGSASLTVSYSVNDGPSVDSVSLTDAGNYTIQYSARVTAASGATYDINGTMSLTIHKRLAYIVAQSAWKSYDGTALTQDQYSTVGFIPGHLNSISIATSGSQTAAGVGVNAVTYTPLNPSITNNYNINTMNGTLVVTEFGATVVTAEYTPTHGVPMGNNMNLQNAGKSITLSRSLVADSGLLRRLLG